MASFQTPSAVPAHPQNTVRTEGRLRGWQLRCWRAAWLLVTALVVGLNVLGIPATYNRLLVPCPTGAACPSNALTDEQFRSLSALGLSRSAYATLVVALITATWVVFVAVGAVIFWRRSDHRVALLSALALVLFGGTFGGPDVGGTMAGLAHIGPGWRTLVQVCRILGDVSFAAFLYLFPSGRWVPRRSGWLVLAWAAYEGIVYFLPNSFFSLTSAAGSFTFVALAASVVLAQIYRYRAVSSMAERQQTKWVVFGVVGGAGGFLFLITFANLVLPPIAEWNPLQQLMGNAVTYLLVLLMPISIGIAMLRHQLFDIDVLINRALVYGPLTLTLAALYFGVVVGVQALARLLTGTTSQQPVLIVLSTLVIAALVQPLRRQLQRAIDRRFYRRKYDAAKTVERFAATLRQEVELDQLRTHLLATVEETMQPTNLSLWLVPQTSREQLPRTGGWQ